MQKGMLSKIEDANRGIFILGPAKRKTVWKKLEAAVDSAAVDNVGNPREFPGVEVTESIESKSEDPNINSWIGAGGDGIPKLGEMRSE